MFPIRCDFKTFPEHGQPLRVLDMGETALDEGTFDEYLMEMENHYSAEKVGLAAIIIEHGS